MSLFALVNNRRVFAEPRQRGACPHCGAEMVAKCGQLIRWHWAHRTAECDSWSEPESAWHLATKMAFRELGCSIEQRIERSGVWHIADVVTPGGHVIELQASALSAPKIAAREAHYGEMVWIWRASWTDRIHAGKKGFWWKHGSRAMATSKRPVIWAHDDQSLFQVHLVDREIPHWLGEIDGVTEYGTPSHRVLGRWGYEYSNLAEVVEVLDAERF